MHDDSTPTRHSDCSDDLWDKLGDDAAQEKRDEAELRRLEEEEARGEIFPDPDLTDEDIEEMARIDEANRPATLKLHTVERPALDEARRFVVRCPDLRSR